jgi:hypothetical protein
MVRYIKFREQEICDERNSCLNWFTNESPGDNQILHIVSVACILDILSFQSAYEINSKVILIALFAHA